VSYTAEAVATVTFDVKDHSYRLLRAAHGEPAELTEP